MKLKRPKEKFELLRPCPFCGKCKTYYLVPSQSILCLHCQSKGPTSGDRNNAVKKWNKRAEVSE